MTKHYLNLTNGIEWLEEIQKTNEPFGFLRIQSTTLERKDYTKLLLDLDHDFLMHLALGYHCKVYDCGTNRAFSKTIYTGVPLIRYLLNRYWYNLAPEHVLRVTRAGVCDNMNMVAYFDQIYNQLFVFGSPSMINQKSMIKLKRKLTYYERYLCGDEIKLEGVSRSTSMDGQYLFYADTVKKLLM